MLSLALALLLSSGDVGPGPVVSADWATCEDGRYADLRPDTPLLVVAESMNFAGWEPAFATGFALYRDGTFIARRGMEMVEWRLGPREVAELWNRIGAARLLEIGRSYDRRSERERRRTQSYCSLHFVTPLVTEVHIWKEGCHRTISVQGVPLVALASAFGRPVLPRLPLELVSEARRALSNLPPALVAALRVATTWRPSHGRRWCRGAGCFAEDKTLRHQDLWDGSIDDALTP